MINGCLLYDQLEWDSYIFFSHPFSLMNLTSIRWFPESLSAILARKIKASHCQRSSKILRIHFFFTCWHHNICTKRDPEKLEDLSESSFWSGVKMAKKSRSWGPQLQPLQEKRPWSPSMSHLRLADSGPPRQHCFIQSVDSFWSDVWLKDVFKAIRGRFTTRNAWQLRLQNLEMTLSRKTRVGQKLFFFGLFYLLRFLMFL